MADNEEGECDVVVQSGHHPPDEVMEHRIVLILPHAVVGMKVDIHLSQTMLLEEVMEHADDRVGPLPCVAGFIYEVVYLPWKGFATYPKDSTLARG